eukprot:TRINITY_DN20221_c0_g1_i1.p1 TRINITY_DN20221_c0_g1~~TRINITY_DN20221_c0_g1_i1.p1  ORF type:complete len:470 (+),score=69.07 TRINITY_DN20221_c0_g1_i1:180-1589(+)
MSHRHFTVSVAAAVVTSWLLVVVQGTRVSDSSTGEGVNSGSIASSTRYAQNASYKVHLLVTRHGLSCTNIVEKWGKSADFGRSRMLDPPLGGLGESSSLKMGQDAAAWMRSNNLQPDAVMSSNLGRAMQTALLMFPHEGPLYVAPYIREHASGDSNSPQPQAEQVLALREAVNRSFSVNYQWINTFGGDFGTWDKFEDFLRQSFLPDLLMKLQKEPGSDIVLPVVSHSLFMRDSVVGSLCSRFWTPKGTSKPLNNQVLHLTYEFRSVLPAAGSLDVTPRYVLERADTCEEVASGMRARSSETSPICMSDVGHVCSALVRQYAFSKHYIWERTVESDIVHKVKEISALEKKAAGFKQYVATKDTMLKDLLQSDPFTCSKSWSGCEPSSKCRLSGLTCITRSDYDVDKLKRKIALKLEEVDAVSAEVQGKETELTNLKNTQCRAGGMPDPDWYLRLSGKSVSEQEHELSIA